MRVTSIPGQKLTPHLGKLILISKVPLSSLTGVEVDSLLEDPPERPLGGLEWLPERNPFDFPKPHFYQDYFPERKDFPFQIPFIREESDLVNDPQLDQEETPLNQAEKSTIKDFPLLKSGELELLSTFKRPQDGAVPFEKYLFISLAKKGLVDLFQAIGRCTLKNPIQPDREVIVNKFGFGKILNLFGMRRSNGRTEDSVRRGMRERGARAAETRARRDTEREMRDERENDRRNRIREEEENRKKKEEENKRREEEKK